MGEFVDDVDLCGDRGYEYGGWAGGGMCGDVDIGRGLAADPAVCADRVRFDIDYGIVICAWGVDHVTAAGTNLV